MTKPKSQFRALLAAHKKQLQTQGQKPAKKSQLKKPVADKHGSEGKRQIRLPDRNNLTTANIKTAPFEWLKETKRLETGLDTPGMGAARIQAAERFRTATEAARLTTIRSPGMEVSSGGSGHGTVQDHKIDAMKRCNKWRNLMGKTVLYETLESCVVDDVWKPTETPRGIDTIRCALDIIAWEIGLITKRGYIKRWGQMPVLLVAATESEAAAKVKVTWKAPDITIDRKGISVYSAK